MSKKHTKSFVVCSLMLLVFASLLFSSVFYAILSVLLALIILRRNVTNTIKLAFREESLKYFGKLFLMNFMILSIYPYTFVLPDFEAVALGLFTGMLSLSVSKACARKDINSPSVYKYFPGTVEFNKKLIKYQEIIAPKKCS